MKFKLRDLFSNKRNIIKIFLDVILIILGITFAFMIRFENSWRSILSYKYFIVYIVIFLALYLKYELNTKSWTFTNLVDVIRIIFVNGVATISTLLYFSVTKYFYSRVAIILMPVFCIILQLLCRFAFIMLRYKNIIRNKNNSEEENALIYGAGEAGYSLAKEQKRTKNFPYEIKAFIDDDKRKIGTSLNDIKVVGGFDNLEDAIQRFEIKTVIIAMPTVRKEKLQKIVSKIEEIPNVKMKILPTIDCILNSDDLSSQIKNVEIEDLLGREQVLVNGQNINKLIESKIIFVTGGAGSIGSELIRQICKYNPKQVIAIDLNENDLYFLELEIKRKFPNLKFNSEIASVREKEKIEYLFKKYKPQILFHAAAHKHVPLMENNPEEAIKNNIFGTKNLIELSDKYKLERFVLISTDKAVNPTNVMGATKRACELLLDDMNQKSNTKYMAVRFGNVLGSNGSVIPYFKKLISAGKNLTVTHREITRYFMTIEEAAQLVIEAGALGNGGEIFILDMGEPIKIIDLAKSMIKLSGANVGIDITGLREGEKLYEELLYDVNNAEKTDNKKIFITKVDEGNVDVAYHINKLENSIKNSDKEELKSLLKEFISSYKEPAHHKINNGSK